ncbi:MAG: hypothetical protein GY847_22235, partial [Proteobacteria bacterium]|nr:hypothetical protein [Pseudomonadota bacterium]
MSALIRELESIYLVRAKLLAQTKPTLPQSIALDREEREMIEMHVAWEAIRDLSWSEQRELIWDRLQHSTPLFFHFLREKSISEGREDRMRGVQLAELALESLAVTEQISGRNAGSLRAQGLAWLGNARRLAFDFPGAEKAFSDAEAFLPDDNDEPLIVAEFYELKAALRLWQRCFSEALALSGSALPIFR